jgi:hypothetical protein
MWLRKALIPFPFRYFIGPVQHNFPSEIRDRPGQTT